MYYFKIVDGTTTLAYCTSSTEQPQYLPEYPFGPYGYEPATKDEYEAWAQQRRDAEKQASMTNAALREQLDNALAANKLLEQQITFLEDCLLEMADEVYA